MGGIIRRRHVYDIIDCEDPNGNTPLSEAAGRAHNSYTNVTKSLQSVQNVYIWGNTSSACMLSNYSRVNNNNINIVSCTSTACGYK